MNICQDWRHSEIVYTEKQCPLCKALSEIENIKDQLDEVTKELKEAQELDAPSF